MSEGIRKETWIGVGILVVGLMIAIILGLPAYMKSTAEQLHPEPRSAPSVTQSEPAPQWAEAAERGRQIMKAGLSEQNLPGLSVAVGIDGVLVWAEGFGFADLKADPLLRIRRPVGDTARVADHCRDDH